MKWRKDPPVPSSSSFFLSFLLLPVFLFFFFSLLSSSSVLGEWLQTKRWRSSKSVAVHWTPTPCGLQFRSYCKCPVHRRAEVVLNEPSLLLFCRSLWWSVDWESASTRELRGRQKITPNLSDCWNLRSATNSVINVEKLPPDCHFRTIYWQLQKGLEARVCCDVLNSAMPDKGCFFLFLVLQCSLSFVCLVVDQFPVFSVRSVSCVQCSISFVCSVFDQFPVFSVRSVSCAQCSISFVCSVFDQFRLLIWEQMLVTVCHFSFTCC